ncbi:MAG: alpha/beta hydrolase [Pseudomonadota bacterium]
MTPFPARRLRQVLIVSVLLVAAAYGGVLLWFRFNEDALLFHPDKGPLVAAPAHLHLDSRDVKLSSGDSTPLVARLVPPPSGTPAADAGWILYCHGASGNVGTLGYNDAWARFRRMGLGVLAVDYRGFGDSGGTPSESGSYRDATAAYDYLTGILHVPPARILIYGYSLGSAVAIDLASRVPAAGLIVEGALLSVPIRGAELYPFVPVSALARNRFASVDKIARVTMPKLFVHARADASVPIAHGRRLFDLAAPPKYFQDVAGGHTNAYLVDPEFFAAIARFVAKLGLPLAPTVAPEIQ